MGNSASKKSPTDQKRYGHSNGPKKSAPGGSDFYEPERKPLAQGMIGELLRLPQPVLLCYANTYRPQYSLLFDSESDIALGSATTTPISGACAVDLSKSTKGQVVIHGVTANGNRLEIMIRRHPKQKGDYLGTVSIGRTKLEDRVIYSPRGAHKKINGSKA